MRKRINLSDGHKMPLIGYGTWQMPESSETEQVVLASLEAGYRLLDTATLYKNEVSIGRAVANSGLQRADIFVTTKLWRTDLRYKDAIAACEQSLTRLGLEYVDLYLIHWPDTYRDEAWRALAALKAEGRARSIGVSNYGVAELEELLGQTAEPPVVNQIELHPFNYQRQKEVLAFCASQNIVVQAYSPLVRGNQLGNPIITKIAQECGVTPAQVLIRWCIQHGTVPLPKSSSVARIYENIDVFDFALSDEQMQALNELSG